MRAVIFGVVLAVSLTGCGCRKSPEEPHESRVTWNRYTTSDGTCSAEFPGKPHSITGADLSYTQLGFGADYILIPQPIPPELLLFSDDGILDGMRDYFRNLDRTPLNIASRKISVDRHLGWECEFLRSDERSLKTRVRYKVLIAHGTTYQLITTISQERDDPDMKRFIDSFRFETPKP